MTRRSVAIFVAAIVTLGGAALIVGQRQGPAAVPDRVPSQRPELLLLTSLPILFGEEFTLQNAPSPTFGRLERRYRVRPIALAEATQLSGARLLLMAHPRAQPAQALVDLDHWVRGGGSVLLLADPLLDWPSRHPLGDRLRPPPAFADTGLLEHWGLRLDRTDTRGTAAVQLDGRRVTLSSPGRLAARACAIVADGLVARCAIGLGRATVIADADLLDPDMVGDGLGDNLDAIMAELARLESPPRP